MDLWEVLYFLEVQPLVIGLTLERLHVMTTHPGRLGLSRLTVRGIDWILVPNSVINASSRIGYIGTPREKTSQVT